MNNLKITSKGISPVIATALLLIVAVMAVAFFQGWFFDFSSKMLIKVESESSTSLENTGIETVIGNYLYFKNGDENLEISLIKVGEKNCNISLILDIGMNEINLNGCTENLSTQINEILVITDKKIFSKYVQLNTNINSYPFKIDCLYNDNKNFCLNRYQLNSVTLLDKNLGLEWERQPLVTTMNWTDAIIYCQNKTLAGYDDWRLPSISEFIYSIYDFNRTSSPYIVNGSGFFNVTNNSYWSYSKYSTININVINFNSQSIGINLINNSNLEVICVRDNLNPSPKWKSIQNKVLSGGFTQTRASSEFIFNASFCGDGTIYDRVTGLCWEENFNRTSTMNLDNARLNCSNLILAGHDDWRLPYINEQISLSNMGLWGSTGSNFNTIGFRNLTGNYYWSDTYSVVGFGWRSAEGIYTTLGLLSNYSVVCVRNSE